MIAGVLADRSGRRFTNIAAGVVFAVASMLCARWPTACRR